MPLDCRTHRHEPPVCGGDIPIVSESAEELVVDKPCTVPIHPCGSYRWAAALEQQWGGLFLHARAHVVFRRSARSALRSGCCCCCGGGGGNIINPDRCVLGWGGHHPDCGCVLSGVIGRRVCVARTGSLCHLRLHVSSQGVPLEKHDEAFLGTRSSLVSFFSVFGDDCPTCASVQPPPHPYVVNGLTTVA